MNGEGWSSRSRECASSGHRLRAATEQAQAKVLAATHQTPDAQTYDYRIHMLLSALMLIAALAIAHLR